MRIAVAYRMVPGRIGWETGASVVRALRRLGHDAQHFAKVYQVNTCYVPSWPLQEAELLVCCECNDMEPQYDLEEYKCPKVYWEFDTSMHEDASAEWVQYWGFDVWFMGNKRMASKYGTPYLPYGFDEEIFKPLPWKRHIAAIIGSPFPERVEFAKRMGIGMKTGIMNEDYVNEVSSMLVHVHHFDSGGDGLIVMRPFETMGLGTCLLTKRTPEIEELFEDGKHCVMYDSEDDGRDKLRWLMHNPEAAITIGRQGRREVLARHTYLHRAWSMLEALR